MAFRLIKLDFYKLEIAYKSNTLTSCLLNIAPLQSGGKHWNTELIWKETKKKTSKDLFYYL